MLAASHRWIRKESLEYFFDSIKIELDKMDIVDDNTYTSLMEEPSGPRTRITCPGFSFAHSGLIQMSGRFCSNYARENA